MLRGLSRSGIAVLNADDPRVRVMAALTDARIVTFGFVRGSDVRAIERASTGRAARGWWSRSAARRMCSGCVDRLGRNVPGAGGTRCRLGRGLPAGTGRTRPGAGASDRTPAADAAGGRRLAIRDDFKGTLETIEAALEVLQEAPGRRIAVLGEIEDPPGSQGPLFRAVGRRLATSADLAVMIGGKRSFKRYRRGAADAGFVACHAAPMSGGAAAQRCRRGAVGAAAGRRGAGQGAARNGSSASPWPSRAARFAATSSSAIFAACVATPARRWRTGWTDDPRLVLGR